jgi:serine/threonine protein kinase
MSGDQDRLMEIFGEALKQPSPEARARYLVEACGGDAQLRHQVEILLNAHARAGEFLKPPAEDPPDSEVAGTMIGRYKLLQLIGEGGFGRVYMAEQLEPVRRKVALKIIKLGMDTREVIVRFEAERQALAMMDHPNIAKILDAGVTGGGQRSEVGSQRSEVNRAGTMAGDQEFGQNRDLSAVVCPPSFGSGRPYFVMELVKGIPITDYCDQRNLATEKRLRLFMRVCHAVQHAHQKGVIHRDLKPTNILVTEHDGEAVPKVIDFGVAKAIGQPLTDKTLFTRLEQMIGTPAYMSPEQAGLGSLDLDTRTDVYTLGVLLYELLTGTTPFEKETLKQAALDEVRRLIRETEPPKPSTRLTALARSQKSEVRGQKPEVRWKEVRGDLDWIVMKSIEKDRRRRYDTADALAQDLERCLNHEPVLAGPPSAAYRARKFIRRHRVGVGMAAAVSTALLVGLLVALIGFTRATRERDKAQLAQRQATDAATTAQAVSDFLQQDLLAQADPWVNPTNLDLRKRALVDLAAARVGNRFQDQPRVEAEIRLTLSRLYRSLGDPDNAETNAQRALAIRRQEFGAEHASTLEAMEQLAAAMQGQGRNREMETLESQVLEVRQRLLGDEHPDTLKARFFLAVIRDRSQHSAETIPRMEELVRLNRRVLGAEHRTTLASLRFLGNLYDSAGRRDEAVKALEEVVTMARRVLGVGDRDTVHAVGDLGSVYAALGRHEEAVQLLREAVEAYDRVRPGDWDVGNLSMDLARQYQRLDRCEEMFAFLEKRLESIPKPGNVHHWSTMSLAWLYGELGYWSDACRHHRTLGLVYHWPGEGWSAAALAALAASDTNSFREAGGALMRWFDQLGSKPITTLMHTEEGEVAGAWREAARCLQPILLRPEWLPDLREQALSLADTATTVAPNDDFCQVTKGMAEYRKGNWREALRWLAKSAPNIRYPNEPEMAWLCFFAMSHHQLGDRAAALAVLEEVNRHLTAMLHTGVVRDDLGLVARAEAERLILGKELSPPVTVESLAAARRKWQPVSSLLWRGNASAKTSDWSAARDAYLQALGSPAFDWEAAELWDQGPDSPPHVMIKSAISMLRVGDVPAYQGLCRNLLTRPLGSSDFYAPAHRLRARVCLLGPQTLAPDLESRLRELVRHATPPDDESETRWAYFTQGLAAYRRGAHAEAIAACQQAEAVPNQDLVQCSARACRAMALWQSGQKEEGARILKEAESVLAKLRDGPECTWFDLEACQVLLDEAHRLVVRPGK